MARIVVAGAGLAGLSAAAALGQAGHQVTVLEARPYAGGRATSYPDPSGRTIDNCQHILLACCLNLRDFYRRLNVSSHIRFHREFFFIEPGGRTSTMRAGLLPKPLHFTESFAALRFLSLADKLAVARALLAISAQWRKRPGLDDITMAAWLNEQRQTPRAIERFWRQVLVSAINEELDRMAAAHGIQVMALGFLAASNSYEMGVPDVPLGRLYSAEAWRAIPNVDFRFRTTAQRLTTENGLVAQIETSAGPLRADHFISALPWDRAAALAPQLELDITPFQPSPITGIHLWFDRPVTSLPHATLLDGTLQWMFNKDDGRYLQLVVSASRSLTKMPRAEVIALALAELASYFPETRTARLLSAHVVKEIKATFSAAPGLEAKRPPARTPIPNLSLAGDWTRSGWPSTMEGAVRSGYLAAENATKALAAPTQFLLPDLA